METVLISGGTGLVGSHLSKKLRTKGYEVAILSRSDPNSAQAIETADYIIHLAGANIGAKRWTARRKQQILDSRVKTTELMFEQVAASEKPKLKAFISASATGYYGAVTMDKIFTENDPAAPDFLGETCRLWETAADRFRSLGARTVRIRTGVVLTGRGGALAKMSMPVKLGIGSAIGSGRQYLPWIHIDDLCGIYIKAVEDAGMEGAYNAVAPDHRTNLDFTQTLARVLKKPFWFPSVPAFAMKLLFGQMSDILLEGSRVSSGKISRAGYQFLFPELEAALKDLL